LLVSENILIVEDDLGTLNLLKLYLESKGYFVFGAENGEEALEIIENQSLHLIILDIEMPGIDGFEVCKKIRKHLDIPIIFISSRRGVIDKLKCFELGGDDYITKPFDFAELEARLKSNLRRYRQLTKQLSSSKLICGDLEIHLDTYECFLNKEKINLTPIEMKLLILLANQPSQVFNMEQIYDHVWGYDSIGDPQTVKVHIKNLRQKIEKEPTKPQYIITVRGFGYRFIC